MSKNMTFEQFKLSKKFEGKNAEHFTIVLGEILDEIELWKALTELVRLPDGSDGPLVEALDNMIECVDTENQFTQEGLDQYDKAKITLAKARKSGEMK